MCKSLQEQTAEPKKENSDGQLPFRKSEPEVSHYLCQICSQAARGVNQQRWKCSDLLQYTGFWSFVLILIDKGMVKRHQRSTSKCGANKLIPCLFYPERFFFLNPFLFLDNHLNNTPNDHNKNLVFHIPKQKLFLDNYMDLLCQFIVVARLTDHWNLRDKNVLYYLNMLNAMKRSGRGNRYPKELPRILTNSIGKTN